MRKLDFVKIEKGLVQDFMLPAQMKKLIYQFFVREQDEIEKYGGENPKIEISPVFEQIKTIFERKEKNGD